MSCLFRGNNYLGCVEPMQCDLWTWVSNSVPHM